MSDWLGPLMFGVVMTLIFLGFPVAFTLGGAALLFGALGVSLGYFDWVYLSNFPERVFGIMENQVLLAVPFFVLMGTILQRSRLAEDLLHSIGMLFGARRGGLALAVVFVGALLAAATGVVGASVVAMGMISLPVMLRYGYSRELATGTICAAGTLGQLIPPSIVLIVLGDQLEVSAGKLFRGAFVPGLMLATFYAIYVAWVAWRHPGRAPALPPEERGRVRRRSLAARPEGADPAPRADPDRPGEHLPRHRNPHQGRSPSAPSAPSCSRRCADASPSRSCARASRTPPSSRPWWSSLLIGSTGPFTPGLPRGLRGRVDRGHVDGTARREESGSWSSPTWSSSGSGSSSTSSRSPFIVPAPHRPRSSQPGDRRGRHDLVRCDDRDEPAGPRS